jgi:hypothetical protein
MVAAMLYTVVTSYTPGYKDEQWMFLRGFDVWNLIWSQHSEHKLPLAKLLGFCDVWFSGADNRLLLTLIVLVQTLHAGLLTWLIRRWGGATRFDTLLASGLVLFCLFHPNQWENFTWGFQIQFVLAFFFAGIAAAGAVSGWRWAAVGGAAAATFDLASGVLVWPILLLAAWAYRRDRTTWVTYAGVMILVLAAFFWNWKPVEYHGIPWKALLTPLPVGLYWFRYFGASWDALALPHQVSDSLAALAILRVAAAAWSLIRRGAPADRPLWVFSTLGALFVLGTGLLTALGRVRFGAEQAMTSRYQTPALLLWLFLALMLWDRLHSVRLARTALGVFLAVAAALTWYRIDPITAGAYRWQHRVDRALAGVYSGYADNEDTIHFGTDRDWVRELLPKIQREGWMGIRRAAFPIGSSIGTAGIAEARIETLRQVQGGGFRVSGWVYSLEDPVATVRAVGPDGRVAGFGASYVERPDLKGAPLYWGWIAYFPAALDPATVRIAGRTRSGQWLLMPGHAGDALRADTVQTLTPDREGELLNGAVPLWLPADPAPVPTNGRLISATEFLPLTGDSQLLFALRMPAQTMDSLLVDIEVQQTDSIEYYFGGAQGSLLPLKIQGRFYLLIRASQNPDWRAQAVTHLRLDPGGLDTIGKPVQIRAIYGLPRPDPPGLPLYQAFVR